MSSKTRLSLDSPMDRKKQLPDKLKLTHSKWCRGSKEGGWGGEEGENRSLGDALLLAVCCSGESNLCVGIKGPGCQKVFFGISLKQHYEMNGDREYWSLVIPCSKKKDLCIYSFPLLF